MRLGWGILAVTGLLLMTIGSVWFLSTSDYLLAQEATTAPWVVVLRGVGLALTMLLGVFSSFAVERLRADDAVKPWRALRSVLTNRKFITAVIITPLVFNGVYASTKENPQGVADFLLAYQNGFFWQALLDRLRSGNAL